MKIAIDGPAGAGKSTIAKLVAARLGITYLDTGAMYRAVGLKAIRGGVDIGDAAAVERMLSATDVRVSIGEGGQRIELDGEDVTGKIRTGEVSLAASAISAVPCVRLKMVELQRAIAARASAVLDGRDIGTFVLPDAECKIFLTASVDERARRRYEELRLKGEDCSLESVRADVIARDGNDSSRALAPLKKADDAIEVDTTCMTIDEVVEKILGLVGERTGKKDGK